MRLPQLSNTTKRVLEVLVVAAAIVLAILSLRTPTPPSEATPSSNGGLTSDVLTPDEPGKSVLVVTGGALQEKTVKAAATRIKWGADVGVHEGAGISRAPSGDKPLAVAVRSDAKDVDDDMIVVQGGEFDGAASDRELEVAIYHLIDWVVAYKPKNAIFVLAGPIPSSATPTPDLVRANHLMRLTAARRQVRYIDAIELGWTTSMDLTKPLGDQLIVSSKPRVFPSLKPEPSPTGSAVEESPTPAVTPVLPPPSPSTTPTSGTTSAAAVAPTRADAPSPSPSPASPRSYPVVSASPTRPAADGSKPSPSPKPSPTPR